MVRYPRAGKDKTWTEEELQDMPREWHRDTLCERGDLDGVVRIQSDGEVTVCWSYTYQWQGRSCASPCGTWPFVSMFTVRSERDLAIAHLGLGLQPVSRKKRAPSVLPSDVGPAKVDLSTSQLIGEWLRRGGDATAALDKLTSLASMKGHGDGKQRKQTADGFLRMRAVTDRVSLGKSAIYDLMSSNEFPKPVRLTGKSVGWLASEVDEWMRQRVAARRAAR